jgi:hypothetical protein
MATNRIFRSGSVYFEFGPHSIYEDAYERIVVQFKDELFPDHWCIDFKDELKVPRTSNVKSDLILIDKLYLEWVLVEVEIARHSWSGHVSDQIQRLELAEVTQKSIDRLIEQNTFLEKDRLSLLFSNQNQRVLVVCNDTPRWQNKFSETSAELMIVRPFRDDQHDLLLQSEREFRRRGRQIISKLEVPAQEQPGWYQILSPHAIPLTEGNVQLSFDNEVLSGKIRRLGQYWYLVVSQGVSIVRNDNLAITGVAGIVFEINGKVVQDEH